MSELKPCPFCGGKAGALRLGVSMIRMYSQVVCTECGASTGKIDMSYDYACEEKAVEAWNRRVKDE